MLNNFVTVLVASWLLAPINALFLTLDGIVYSLVSYSYKLFMLITQVNYNVIYTIISPLLDRINAVIMVFILFKVGVAFLQYLVEPEKFDDKTKGGKQLVVNVLIVAGILGISGFVFGLFNDLSMLVLGTFGGAESFKVINVESGDPIIKNGLITRLIFGSDEKMTSADNFGKYIATSTMNIFLYDVDPKKSNEASSLYTSIINSNDKPVDASVGTNSSDFDMMKIVTLADDIGRTVYYRYPLFSTLMGLFMLYSIVKLALHVGVRMFKLIVLQIIAPLPIISIVSDGVNGQTFKKYTSLFLSTFVGAFVSVAFFYLTIGFLTEFYMQLSGQASNGSLFGSTDVMKDISFFTKGMLLIILSVSAFTFLNELPKFLSGIFGNMDFQTDKGFGKFLKSTIGAGVGGIGGYALGRASGLKFGDALLNAGASAVQGAKGAKISEVMKSSSTRAAGAIEAGGMINSGLNTLSDTYGLRAARDSRLGIEESRQNNDISAAEGAIKEQDKKIKSAQQSSAAVRKLNEAAAREVRGKETDFGKKFGSMRGVSSAADLFSRVKSNDTELAKLQYSLKGAANETEYAKISKDISGREAQLQQETEDAYNIALDATKVIADSGTKEDFVGRQAVLDSNDAEVEQRTAYKDTIDEYIAGKNSTVKEVNKEKGKGMFSTEKYKKPDKK